FQAEDGIRARNVTGVQTCALPIYPLFVTERHEPRSVPGHRRVRFLRPRGPGLRVDIRVFSVSPSRGASETWRPPAVGRSGTSTRGYGAPATVWSPPARSSARPCRWTAPAPPPAGGVPGRRWVGSG